MWSLFSLFLYFFISFRLFLFFFFSSLSISFSLQFFSSHYDYTHNWLLVILRNHFAKFCFRQILHKIIYVYISSLLFFLFVCTIIIIRSTCSYHSYLHNTFILLCRNSYLIITLLKRYRKTLNEILFNLIPIPSTLSLVFIILFLFSRAPWYPRSSSRCTSFS